MKLCVCMHVREYACVPVCRHVWVCAQVACCSAQQNEVKSHSALVLTAVPGGAVADLVTGMI